ncbi:MAG: methionine--tRNA ligase [Candidatus Phytoplasma pyri]
MKKKEKFYLATAIAYASDIPHVGNVYEVVLADCLARFKRLEGYDVYFQTGTDEHGQKILQKSKSKNEKPQTYVDYFSKEIRRIYDLMNVSYDKFVKTSNENHKKSVQAILDKLYQQKDIYLGKYEGFYSVIEESYILEKDLVNGLTKNGEIPIWSSEEVYFFKLSKYQKKLYDFLKNNNFLIKPDNKKQEILNLLKEPLPDLCITRTFCKYGINLNFNSKHFVYVWIDALLNYITGLNYHPNLSKSKEFSKYWPCDLHIIGKDIIRFHLIHFLILLISLELPLPKQFFIHPFILFGKNKMSKSKGNVLYIDDLLKIFSVDTIRYFMLHEIPYNQDGNITHELLIERNNTDLANTIGNLLNRTLGMLKAYRNCNLKKVILPEILEIDLSKKSLEALPLIKQKIFNFHVSDALEVIMKLARFSNKYIDLSKPWELFKETDKQDVLDHVLYSLVETLRFIGVLLQPFLPTTAASILKQIKSENNTFASLEIFGVTESKTISSKEILFIRFENNN